MGAFPTILLSVGDESGHPKLNIFAGGQSSASAVWCSMVREKIEMVRDAPYAIIDNYRILKSAKCIHYPYALK